MEARGKNKEIEDLRRQEASRQERIMKAKEDLAAAELELENLPVYEPPKDELVHFTFQLNNLYLVCLFTIFFARVTKKKTTLELLKEDSVDWCRKNGNQKHTMGVRK